jgi:predicted TIM-barrel fold metal-dependent hydrolase
MKTADVHAHCAVPAAMALMGRKLEICAAHPDRFVAFASVALQHPDLVVEQLEHGVKRYGLRGAGWLLRRVLRQRPPKRRGAVVDALRHAACPGRRGAR